MARFYQLAVGCFMSGFLVLQNCSPAEAEIIKLTCSIYRADLSKTIADIYEIDPERQEISSGPPQYFVWRTRTSKGIMTIDYYVNINSERALITVTTTTSTFSKLGITEIGLKTGTYTDASRITDFDPASTRGPADDPLLNYQRTGSCKKTGG
jgi:hypothetical protein